MTERIIEVVKSNGEREPFNRDKLLHSLRSAGADAAFASEVAAHVEKELVNGMKTEDIYRHAFEYLRTRKRPAAARYSLKRALIELGPTGFPFERFVAEIFKARGYEASVELVGKGKCIEHELDVVAWNTAELIVVEAKFHNTLGIKSDAKVALYVKARFDDLRETPFSCGGSETRRMSAGWLITNTKFTTNAIQYGECAGLKLVGWNYPRKGNLADLIEETGLHPITCLTTLSTGEKKQLMERGVVLCRSIRDESNGATLAVLSLDALERAREESMAVCPGA